jgi:hypothetical protein
MTFYTIPISLKHAIYPAHLILHDMIILIIFVKKIQIMELLIILNPAL